jgi:hypothetical protein
MEKKDGINVENITFDANGEVAGLDDTTLDTIAAGAGVATNPEMDDEWNICWNGSCGVVAAE